MESHERVPQFITLQDGSQLPAPLALAEQLGADESWIRELNRGDPTRYGGELRHTASTSLEIAFASPEPIRRYIALGNAMRSYRELAEQQSACHDEALLMLN